MNENSEKWICDSCFEIQETSKPPMNEKPRCKKCIEFTSMLNEVPINIIQETVLRRLRQIELGIYESISSKNFSNQEKLKEREKTNIKIMYFNLEHYLDLMFKLERVKNHPETLTKEEKEIYGIKI